MRRAATTTPGERQRIARLLIEHVTVRADKAGERVGVELHWVGGQVESHMLSAAEIAERLNEEGFRPPKRVERFNRSMVRRLLSRLALAHRQPHGSLASPSPDEYRPGRLARRLEISPDTVRRWLRVGWLTSTRDGEGHQVIWADASELDRLRELHELPRTWATKDRLVELTRPKPRPVR